jgi:hypothetical protein
MKARIFICSNEMIRLPYSGLAKISCLMQIDLAMENPLLRVLDNIAENDRIKVLVVMNCPEQMGCEAYIHFCRQVFKAEFDRRLIKRICNFFDQLILIDDRGLLNRISKSILIV